MRQIDRIRNPDPPDEARDYAANELWFSMRREFNRNHDALALAGYFKRDK